MEKPPTISLDTDAEAQSVALAGHIATLVAKCLALSPKPEAIILYGSYGRGEGGWFQDSAGLWRPYNDYDLCLICRDHISDAMLTSLKSELTDCLGIRWIDFCQFHPNTLKRLKPSIFSYDLKYASSVVYGDRAIVDNIPTMDSTELPLKEVQTLFLTRLYTLIGSVEEKAIETGLVGEPSRFFRNQMAKAILAIVDVLLLTNSSYHASYKTRVIRIMESYPEKVELLELSRWALAEKLHPCDALMTSAEIRGLYGKVTRAYFREMYPVLSRHYKRLVKSAEDIETCLLRTLTQRLKRLCWRLWFRDCRMDRRLFANVAQCYIAEAWTDGYINSERLQRGIKLLHAAGGNTTPWMTWEEARREIVRVRMLV